MPADLKILIQAAATAETLLENCAQTLKPGQSEDQITKNVLSQMAALGIKKNWHKPIIRVGVNTVLKFGVAPLDSKVTLSDSDLCILDLGPVIGQYEADIAETFVLGSDPEHLRIKHSSKIVWQKTCDMWKKKSLSGTDMLSYASELANEIGYTLDIEEAGHRIGKFPHDRDAPSKLFKNPSLIPPGEWVLEIKLISKDSQTKKIGSFYERILV